MDEIIGMPLSTGDKLGPYEILSAIGAGGMGEVYKARDTRLDRTVAVKVLPERVSQREDVRARFEREARAVASLNHPNICSLFDIGPGYMVMELIEGETLAARIAKGALPLDQALKFALQIADALDRAHRAGVTHRDVKPQNIMLTRDGVKVLDFGLAKSSSKPGPTEETLTKVLTSEGTVMGTPQYMAPEQFEGREADARSDIWAFGAVLYEMVTGRKAFEGKSYSSLLGAILSAEPAPMAVSPFTPAWLERLVRRCLAKEPERRYQSMRDVVLDLEAPPVDMVGAKASRLPWVVAGAAIVVAIAGSWLSFKLPPKGGVEGPIRLSIVPPENGSVSAFTISPDGTRIALTVVKDGKSRIWLRRLDSDVAVAVAGTEGAGAKEAATWSPDGEQLAFVADERLKLVSIRSGKVKDLERARNRGIAWNKDDVILFVDFEQTIRKISASGGQSQKLQLDLAGPGGARFPQFLPDQNRFLYLSRQTGLRVGSLDGKTNKSILPQQRTGAELVVEPEGDSGWILFERSESLFAHRFNLKNMELEGKAVELSDAVGRGDGGTGRAMFSTHGRLLAYRAAESNSTRLVWYDPSGKRLQEVGEPNASYGQVRISPDGRQALVTRFTGRDDRRIETIDLLSGTSTRRTFADPAEDGVWSRDGKSIFFILTRNGERQIVQTAADWSSPPVLVHSGKEISYLTDYQPLHQTLLLNTFLSQGRTLTRGESGWVTGKFSNPDEGFAKGAFSPDGRWVVYQNWTSAPGVFLMPYPATGAKWQISANGQEPVWRHDGKEVIYIQGDELMAVSVEGSDRAPRIGSPRTVFQITLPPALLSGMRFGVAPDGKFLVMERLNEPPGAPISVLLNWRSLLGTKQD